LAGGLLGLFTHACGIQAEVATDANPEKEMRAILYQGASDQKSRVDQIFEIPGWEDRMAKHIAELVTAARISPEDLRGYYNIFGEPGSRSPQLKRDPPDADIAAARRVEASLNARRMLNSLLGTLTNMRDRRIVPFVAPLLAETTPAFHGDDYSISEPQERARELLAHYARLGIIENVPQTLDLSIRQFAAWRKWWAEHRDEYPPVPEPLRAIDAGEASGNAPKPPAPAAGSHSTPPPPRPTAPAIPTPADPDSTADSRQPAFKLLLVGAGAALALAAVFFALRRRR
jgi:hypothetical protein